MATLTRQKARKEYECSKCESTIKVGDEYYRFSLTRFQKKEPRCVKCRPKRSEMTTSDFLSTIYDIDDSVQALTVEDMEDPSAIIEDIKGQLEELQTETDERAENMPEQFQDGDVATMLRERVESVKEMVNELEAVDTEIDDGLTEEEKEERREAILDEIQAVSWSG